MIRQHALNGIGIRRRDEAKIACHVQNYSHTRSIVPQFLGRRKTDRRPFYPG
jgi:hypothetical protein